MLGSLTGIANERISIALACRWAGVSVSEGDGSRKIWCPFGSVSHSDGGVERAFRMYEGTNSAYCFRVSQVLVSGRLDGRVLGLLSCRGGGAHVPVDGRCSARLARAVGGAAVPCPVGYRVPG